MPSYNKGCGKGIQWIYEHASYDLDECLPWPFGRDDKGYGHFGYEGKTYKAPRFMCELVNGPPPTDKHEAAHSCGNGAQGCANPKHLFWKTRSENQLDRRVHGTTITNKWGSGGKLTRKEQEEILALKGRMTQRKIAAMYGIHHDTIGRIHRKGLTKLQKLRPWQPEEDAILLQAMDGSLQMASAAERLGRTLGSIYSRVGRLQKQS